MIEVSNIYVCLLQCNEGSKEDSAAELLALLRNLMRKDEASYLLLISSLFLYLPFSHITLPYFISHYVKSKVLIVTAEKYSDS